MKFKLEGVLWARYLTAKRTANLAELCGHGISPQMEKRRFITNFITSLTSPPLPLLPYPYRKQRPFPTLRKILFYGLVNVFQVQLKQMKEMYIDLLLNVYKYYYRINFISIEHLCIFLIRSFLK